MALSAKNIYYRKKKMSIPGLSQQTDKYLDQPYHLKVRVLHEIKKGLGSH